MKKTLAIFGIVVRFMALFGWLYFLPMLGAQSDMSHSGKIIWYLVCGAGGGLCLLQLIAAWKKNFNK